ncbi:MAG: hypothetical protein JWP87_5652 [Labilithrix sp.]|nr:hypothetical protein [Labilithrix sp.]
MSARLLACALLAALALGLGGCGPDYDHTDIASVRSPPAPLTGHVDYARVQVSLGAVVTAHIVPYDDDHKVMSVDLRSKDPSVVEVTNVVSDHDYAFLGMKTGTTEVELRADGHLVLILTAVVTDQPPL